LEMAASDAGSVASEAVLTNSGALDIRPIIRHIVEGVLAGRGVGALAAEFHFELVELFVAAALEARKITGIDVVGLSGGVYQNVLFFERIVARLQAERFTLLTHSDVPTNDGGLALGQVLIADAQYNSGKKV